MALARLFIKELGKTELVQNNGDYATPEEAHSEGERLISLGTIHYFEVWTRVGAFQRKIVVEAAEEAAA